MVLGGIVLIVLAALWLLRGIVFTLTATGITHTGGLVSLLVGVIALTGGVVLVRRGLARRRLFSPPT